MISVMHVRLRMYMYCYSNLGAIYAKSLLLEEVHCSIQIVCSSVSAPYSIHNREMINKFDF